MDDTNSILQDVASGRWRAEAKRNRIPVPSFEPPPKFACPTRSFPPLATVLEAQRKEALRMLVCVERADAQQQTHQRTHLAILGIDRSSIRTAGLGAKLTWMLECLGEAAAEAYQNGADMAAESLKTVVIDDPAMELVD